MDEVEKVIWTDDAIKSLEDSGLCVMPGEKVSGTIN